MNDCDLCGGVHYGSVGCPYVFMDPPVIPDWVDEEHRKLMEAAVVRRGNHG